MILSKCKHISEIVIFFDFLLIILVVSSAEEERSFYKSRPQVDPKGDDDDIDSNNNNNNKNNNSDGPGWNATNLEFDKIREKKKTIRKYSTYNDEMFTFGMFENFQLTREVLCEEIKLVAELRSLRRALQGKIAYLITTTTAAAAAAPSSSWRDERELGRLDEIRNRVEKLEEQFPTGYHDEEGAGDYEGALRGLVFLQDTYGFDLKALSRGRLVSKAYPKGPLNLPNDHKLVLEDFYRLSKMSFSFKWYDRAIDFLAAAFKLLVAKKSGEAEGEANDDAKLAATMEKMRNNLVILNNRNLFKWKKSVSGDFKLHPFEIGDTLRKKKTQPDYVTRGEVKTKDRISRNGREAHFRQSCNGLFTPSSVVNASGLVAVVVTQCQLLHHGDPYLKLGPFKVEISSQSPLVMVFHDFFSEAEMQFLVEHSRPNLSRRRYADPYNDAIDLGLRKTKKVTRIIHKSVQYWIKELEYDRYYDNLHELEQNDSYKIHFPQMFRLTQKIELATSLNATSKYAATDYQTTNYGLGGLCETHFDPHGYIEGQELPPHPGFQRLKKQGDMMATMMGWLEDVEVGGATAFADPGNEVLVWPRRGSAAFWFNLDRKGFRDTRLLHGGCPVIKGSKWIMNKWIFYFDQFRKFPCGLKENDKNKPFRGVY